LQGSFVPGDVLVAQARGCHEQPDRRLSSLQDPGGHAQVFELGAGARADVGELRRHFFELGHRPGVGRAVRRCDLRRELARVEAVVG
jgi:hypothetical protein